MKTKYLFLFFIMILFLSCRAKQHVVTSLDYIMIYDNYDAYGKRSLRPLPEVLILKKISEYPELNSYEAYFYDNESVLGKWSVVGDTLYLFPLYEYNYDTIPHIDKVDINENDPYYYIDPNRINQKWLIKDDCIYERNDLSMFIKYDKDGKIINDASSYANPNRYLRLRSKTGLKVKR